ncbi:hypothetical protein POM88_035884 [Heracleum sosnowskyi]|uniref:PHD finger protein ALFIN-LIKE n=1 Tax=Heracleum sosnowskyi TaxID=360622 RepID=A0AAD8HP54_9APIA|nr:hypothetical protein POM88_035884 [Heracleum sosnowskyi]
MSIDLMTVSRIDGASITLCEDLTKAVLLKTPIEGLKRCRFASKSWGNWLSKSEFHKQYTARNKHYTARKALVVPASSTDNQLGRKSLFSVSLDCSNHPQPPVFIKKIPFYAFKMFIVASYLGVICLSDSPREIFGRSVLWNPLTGDGKAIDYPPISPLNCVSLNSVSLGFGFDGIDFHVLRLSPTSSRSNLHSTHKYTLLEIFSVETNVWKQVKIKVPFLPLKEHNTFIIDGIPYWEGTNNMDEWFLLWYDVKNDIHGEIPYPIIDELSHFNVCMLSIHDVIVAMITDKSQKCIKSYYLEVDGSWSRGFSVGPYDFLHKGVSGAKYNGGGILCWNLYGGKAFYDTSKNVSLDVPDLERFSPEWSQAVAYEETFRGVGSGAMLFTEENLKCWKYRCPSLENIYKDLVCRRDAIIKALTKDLDKFRCCLNADLAQHCLYGFTDEHWEVKVPDDQFGLGFPHPKPVTYLDRHLKDENIWLAHVSLQSESWLYSIADYYIAELGLAAEERDKLWSMLLLLPPINKATGFAQIQPIEDDEEYIDFA